MRPAARPAPILPGAGAQFHNPEVPGKGGGVHLMYSRFWFGGDIYSELWVGKGWGVVAVIPSCVFLDMKLGWRWVEGVRSCPKSTASGAAFLALL